VLLSSRLFRSGRYGDAAQALVHSHLYNTTVDCLGHSELIAELIAAQLALSSAEAWPAPLAAFLALKQYSRFADDLRLRADGSVVASRFKFYVRQPLDHKQRKAQVAELKRLVAAEPSVALVVDEASYCDQVARLEVLPSIFSQVMRYTNFVMLGVLLLAFSPRSAGLCIVNLLFIQVQLLGAVHQLGSTYNTVSCIVLTLAIGVCVDFSLHIMEKARQVASADQAARMVGALGGIGPEVLNSAVTTLLGISPLLRASSLAMRLVSQLSLVSILYGLFHGLVVLPVLSCIAVHIESRFCRAHACATRCLVRLASPIAMSETANSNNSATSDAVLL